MSSIWIPSYVSLADHPKLRKLCRLLGIPRVQAVGHLHLLWWWAVEHTPDGDLRGVDVEEIATAAEWAGEPIAFVSGLRDSQLLEQRTDGHLVIHDWWDYAGRWVLKKRNAARANHERWHEKRGQIALDCEFCALSWSEKSLREISWSENARVDPDLFLQVRSSGNPELDLDLDLDLDVEGSEVSSTSSQAGFRAGAGAPKSAHALDPAFESLVEIEEANRSELTRRAKRAIGVALAEIRDVTPEVAPAEIRRRAGIYLQLMPPNTRVTAMGLSKHWARCADEPQVLRSHRLSVAEERDLRLREMSKELREVGNAGVGGNGAHPSHVAGGLPGA